MAKNVIVGQSGGPTAVINASLAGVYETAKALGADTVYGMRYGVQGLLAGKVVALDDYLADPLQLELLQRTPSSFLGSCRFKLPDVTVQPEIYRQLFDVLERLDIGCFFYIGGNDSMDTICKLSDYARDIHSPIRFVGVPKTIDNDLEATDHTPGYGSAAKYIATVTKEVIRDSLVYDLQSVTVLEIMGRNAGWLAASAALAKGPDCEGVDFIYLPEAPFEVEDFLQQVALRQRSKSNVVVAVSEGIRTGSGTYVAELGAQLGPQDAFGHKILTGTARYLAEQVSTRLGTKARAIEFSTLQRCGSHMASRVDSTEAHAAGAAAVRAAYEGHTGEMICLVRRSSLPYQCVTHPVDIHAIANREKKVPAEWIAGGCSITEDLLAYMRPLVQGELQPIQVQGLPRHIFLS